MPLIPIISGNFTFRSIENYTIWCYGSIVLIDNLIYNSDMKKLTQIKEIYEKYINTQIEDVNDLKLLAEQLEQNDQDITSRKNFVGHVTASAFVINKFTRQVLLLQHKSLGKLLQPGGHIDKEDGSPLEATLREVEEETGLKPDELVLQPVLRNHPIVPFHIDSHYIPENPRKNEPGHYHHDFRYLYITEKSDINVDLDESNGFQWVDWEVFADDPHFAVVVGRIEDLLEPNPHQLQITKEKKYRS